MTTLFERSRLELRRRTDSLQRLLLGITLFGLEAIGTRAVLANPQYPDGAVATENPLQIESLESFDRSLAQVTGVGQLQDVQSSDWAFGALQSLVERYDCIAGYPDGTFRGDRAMTRYEFAASLKSCLDAILRSPTAEMPENSTAADLETLQRLQTDFRAELAALDARVDALATRTNTLEANQFSTTTKLTANIFTNLTVAAASDDVRVETIDLDAMPLTIRRAGRDSVTGEPIVRVEDDDPAVTYSYYVFLNFNTSFSGKDRLVTQLAVGNGISPANTFVSAGLFNTFGTPFTDQSGTPTPGTFVIRELFYEFPATDTISVVIGPRVNFYRYFDNNRYTFFLTGASSFNSIGSTLISPVDRGSGAVVRWTATDWLELSVGYLGENTEFLPSAFFNTSSDPSTGLFNGTNVLTVQVAVEPIENMNVRLLYNRSAMDNNVPVFDENGTLTGFAVGGSTGEPLNGIADDGFGGTVEPAEADTVGVSFDWTILPKFGVFGRYFYSRTDIDPVADGVDGGEIEAQAIQAGLAFLDLGRQGALLTLSYVIPFSVLDGNEFLVSGGGDGANQFEVEATYFLPVTKNIAIVPAVYAIANPNNFNDNPTIWVGNVRTQFSF